MTINYGRFHFDRACIFRPHNCYGPDMGEEHVIPQLTRQLGERMRDTSEGPLVLPIQGTGNETRAFVFIDDLVEGVLQIIEHGAHLEIYHVGTDEEVSINQLIGLMGRCVGREVRIQSGPLRAGGTPRRCPDIRKLKTLGYAPRVSLETGLKKTVSWYLETPKRIQP
jgi:nucleoside-diphosphate-sugar epimerase